MVLPSKQRHGRLQNVAVVAFYIAVVCTFVLSSCCCNAIPFPSTAVLSRNLLKQQQQENHLPHEQFCFVHVGKTAGSFLACKLGLSETHHIKCPSSRQELQPCSKSLLANKTNGFLHMYWGKGAACSENAANNTTYLVSLRNPIDRIISWFYYERPTSKDARLIPPKHAHKKLLWLDCPYWELEDLSSDGLRPLENTTETVPSSKKLKDMTCQERAWAAVTGKRPFHHHNYMNYDYYLNWTRSLASPHEPCIVALRSEHLQHDWNNLELVQGNADFVNDTMLLNSRLNQGPKKKKSADRLSPLARQQLCRALCHEIQVYKEILQLSENLSDQDRQTSLKELQASCPDLNNMANTTCPDTNGFHIKKECVKPGSDNCNWWVPRRGENKKTASTTSKR